MFTTNWQVGRSEGHCSVTGRLIAEGEAFHAVLFEVGEAFRRVDISDSAWIGVPEGCFCHFKTKAPVRNKRRIVPLDKNAIVSFYHRLEGDSQPQHVRFRFVLALILMRKKVLRYESTTSDFSGTFWRMTKLPELTEETVEQPAMNDPEIEEISARLNQLLSSDVSEQPLAELE